MNSPQPSLGFPAWLVLLGILTAIGPLSIDMYLPSFPQAQQMLEAPAGTMEFTLASFFIGLTIGQLFYGPLSDRFGRKPPLLIGFAIYTIASLGGAFAGNVWILCAWRFLQGIGACAGIIIPSAVVRDKLAARDSAKAFSMLMLVMGLAPILAPLVGGWILQISNWRMIFYVLVGFGFFCFVAIALGLTESHNINHEPPLKLSSVLGNYGHLLFNRAFLGFALSFGLTFSGMLAYIAGSPFVLIELYGVSPGDYGWFFGINAFGLIASSQFNAKLLQRYPATTILKYSLWLPLLAGLCLVILECTNLISLTSFLICFFFFVSSVGWVTPNAMAAALATHGQMAGTAAAFVGALQFLLGTGAGALVGAFQNGTGQPLAVVMALCGCGAWLSHRLLIRHPVHPHPLAHVE